MSAVLRPIYSYYLTISRVAEYLNFPLLCFINPLISCGYRFLIYAFIIDSAVTSVSTAPVCGYYLNSRIKVFYLFIFLSNDYIARLTFLISFIILKFYLLTTDSCFGGSLFR